MTDPTNLPPLPEPVAWREDDGEWIYYDETSHPGLLQHIKRHQKERHGVSIFPLYSAAQVEEIRRAAILAERERCAKVCEEKHANGNWKYDTRHECAAAIREGNK